MKLFTLSAVALAALFGASVATAQTAPATYTTVGIIGSATTGSEAGWQQSIAMTPVANSDGHHWTITLPLTQEPATATAPAKGEVKFRANNAWDVNWGAVDFPTGKGTQGGPNIPIPSAGTYTVTFNDTDGSYNFTTGALATRAGSSELKLSVAPNPAHGSTVISYELKQGATAGVTVLNLLGQTVRTQTALRQNAGAQAQQVSLQGLTPGLYLVRLQAGDQVQTARVQVAE